MLFAKENLRKDYSLKIVVTSKTTTNLVIYFDFITTFCVVRRPLAKIIAWAQSFLDYTISELGFAGDYILRKWIIMDKVQSRMKMVREIGTKNLFQSSV